MIAHELGHAKHNDVLLGTALGGIGGVLGVALLALVLDSERVRRRAGVRGPGDPAVLALVLALTAVGSWRRARSRTASAAPWRHAPTGPRSRRPGRTRSSWRCSDSDRGAVAGRPPRRG